MSVGRAVAMKAGADTVARLASFVTFPIFVRYAGLDGYGAYGQVTAIAAFFVPFASLGLSNAVVRFFADREWDTAVRARMVRVTVIVVLVASLCGLVLSLTASAINTLVLNWPHGSQLFRWGGALIVAGALELFLLEVLRARQQYGYLTGLQLAQTLTLLFATYAVLRAGGSVIGVLQVALLIKGVGAVTVLLGFWSWDRPERPQVRQPFVALGRMLGIGFPLAVAGIGLWLMHAGPQLVIGHFLSATELGVYSAAWALALSLVAVNAPLCLPMYPRLMRAVRLGQSRELETEIQSFNRYGTLLLAPTAIFLVVHGDTLLRLLGGNAVVVDPLLMLLLVVGAFVNQWNSVAHYVLNCFDRVRVTRNAWLLLGLVNIGGSVLLVPTIGLKGAAVMTMLSFVALNAVFYAAASRHVSLWRNFRWDVLAKATAAAGVAASFAWLLGPTGGVHLAHFAVAVTLFACGYVAMLAVLGELGRSEVGALARMLTIRG